MLFFYTESIIYCWISGKSIDYLSRFYLFKLPGIIGIEWKGLILAFRKVACLAIKIVNERLFWYLI
jgi:hypothetical protein